MAAEYFKNFPEILYSLSNDTLSDSKIVTLKDFWRKAKIEQSSLENVIQYTYYELEDGERPDVAASKIYGNGDLHWVFFLVNDFDSYQDWYKSSSEFEQYMDNRYFGKALIVANSFNMIDQSSKLILGETVTSTSATGNVVRVDPSRRKVVVKEKQGTFQSGQVVTGTISGHQITPNEVKDFRDCTVYHTNGTVRSNQAFSGSSEVTYYDMELEKNERRRKIKIIKPELIRTVVSEFEKVLKR